ncbi:hypothetical protein EV359DRAFT_87977 [Lentinula novae-zelandiae]|nr:hypothetical protein EV359DRAFT_87977 [Lentinula novae-zelandiae]
MSSSHTTTRTTTTIGSIPVTGRHPTPPSAPTRPSTPDPSDKERELELQLERTREKNRKRKEEKKKAEEEAKRKAEEERQRQEAAVRAANARKLEEEAAEKRRRMAAAAAVRNRRGPSPGEASTSARRVEVEIPRVVKKGKGRQRIEASGGEPDDGGDSREDDDDDDEERAPCERCQLKKIPCLEQVGKWSTVICKPCHDAKVKCSYLGRPVQVKREGGPSGERMAVMESQLAQLLADNQALREAASRSHQYLRQLLRRQDEDHARLIAIETRNAMTGPAIPGPSRLVSDRPRNLKRRQVIENSEEEEEEEKIVEGEKDGEGEEEVEEGKEEGEVPALKKAKTAASEKGKEKEVE